MLNYVMVLALLFLMHCSTRYHACPAAILFEIISLFIARHAIVIISYCNNCALEPAARRARGIRQRRRAQRHLRGVRPRQPRRRLLGPIGARRPTARNRLRAAARHGRQVSLSLFHLCFLFFFFDFLSSRSAQAQLQPNPFLATRATKLGILVNYCNKFIIRC